MRILLSTEKVKSGIQLSDRCTAKITKTLQIEAELFQCWVFFFSKPLGAEGESHACP